MQRQWIRVHLFEGLKILEISNFFNITTSKFLNKNTKLVYF
jgi:hypothetical protein